MNKTALALYWQVLKQTYAALKERAECKAIAKAFNDRYCYRHTYVGALPPSETFFQDTMCRTGYRWMCPECNAIHAPTGCFIFSGLQYPACCSTGEGDRLNHGIQTSR